MTASHVDTCLAQAWVEKILRPRTAVLPHSHIPHNNQPNPAMPCALRALDAAMLLAVFRVM